jgi:hypothetical protein
VKESHSFGVRLTLPCGKLPISCSACQIAAEPSQPSHGQSVFAETSKIPNENKNRVQISKQKPVWICLCFTLLSEPVVTSAVLVLGGALSSGLHHFCCKVWSMVYGVFMTLGEDSPV